MCRILMQDLHSALLLAHLLHLQLLPQALVGLDDIHNSLVSRSHTSCCMHVQTHLPFLGRLGSSEHMCKLEALSVHHAHR